MSRAAGGWWPGRALPAGSFLWLLAHELRLTGRVFRRRGEGKGGANRDVALAFLIVYQLFYLLVGSALGAAPVDVQSLPRLIATGELLMALFMLSGMLTAIVQWFNERRDLDLLFSSPIASRRVLAVRALTMTCGGWAIAALGLGPLVNGMAVFGAPRWLVFYPVLFAVALLAAAVGMIAIVPLLSLLGPRRAKLVIQVGSVLAFAGVFVTSQARQFLPDEILPGFLKAAAGDRDLFASLPPVRAMLGDGPALAVCLAAGAALFAASIMILGPVFERAAAIEEASAAPRRAAADRAARSRLGGPLFVILLLKELRLIRRFPGIWAQFLMSIAYVLPAVMGLRAGEGFSGATILAGFPVLMVGQVTQTIGWVTTAFDSGAELALSSPVRRRVLRLAKVAATLIGAVSVMAPPLAVFIYARPTVAPAYLGGFLGVALTQMLVVFWASPPATGHALDTRLGIARLPFSAAILGQVMNLGWAVATGLMTLGSWWTLAPIATTTVIVAVLWEERQRSVRSAGLSAPAWF